LGAVTCQHTELARDLNERRWRVSFARATREHPVAGAKPGQWVAWCAQCGSWQPVGPAKREEETA
jgi:hypothetical protein